MTVTEFLSRLSLFCDLKQEEVRTIAESVSQQSYSKDQTVVFKGASVNGLHIVATGKVGVHAKQARNKNTVKVAELGPGEIFGETSILEQSMATATIKVIEDDTLIFVVPERTFSELLQRDPSVHQKTRALIEERKAKSAPLLNPQQPA